MIVVIDAGNATNDYNGMWVRINSDSTDGNYSAIYALGNGSGTISGTTAGNGGRGMAGATGNVVSSTIVQFMDYSTDKHKTYLTRRTTTDGGYGLGMEAARWASTAAITSLQFSDQSTTFKAGSTFTLFGVAA